MEQVCETEQVELEEKFKNYTETYELSVTPEQKELLESGKKILTLNNVFADVDEFIETLNQEKCKLPQIPTGDLLELRKRLIKEEWQEIQDAIEENDLAGYVDGCLDLIYVVAGALLAAGVPADDAQKMWEMVHSANMAKAGGPKDEFGKVQKPAGWKAPDIGLELEKITQKLSS